MQACRWFLPALVLAAVLAPASRTFAWSHQGHILLTRMACLRIINDPASPPEFKAFLQKHMKYDLDACRKLATEEMVGADPKNYLAGIDGAATWPDRVIPTAAGNEEIEPYGVPEAKLHFLDMEYFSKDPTFKPDLSSKPKIEEFPRDLKDFRYKRAGMVPFRTQESFDKLVAALGNKSTPPKEDDAVKWLGYLAHYVEDCHQPHHATADFKSLSYLAGKVKAVRAVTTQAADGSTITDYRVSRTAGVNPHGDVEFQLFENAEEPRKTLRAEFWKELTAQIESQAKSRAAAPAASQDYDGFKRSIEILSESYDYLPLIGEAAVKAYAGDKFDPQAFFTHEGTKAGEKMTIVQLIARRNAAAVLEVESTLRAAWATAKK